MNATTFILALGGSCLVEYVRPREPTEPAFSATKTLVLPHSTSLAAYSRAYT